MNKKSYRSSPTKGCATKLSPKDLLTPPSAEEGLTGEPGGGIGRGYSVPGEPVSAYAPDSERSLDLSKKKTRSKRIDDKRLLDLFVMLADAMDKQGFATEANFADFMIKKIAEQRSLDYSVMFKELLIKIVESDILDKNILLERLTALFNRTMYMSINNGSSIEEGRSLAYNAAVSEAEIYVK